MFANPRNARRFRNAFKPRGFVARSGQAAKQGAKIVAGVLQKAGAADLVRGAVAAGLNAAGKRAGGALYGYVTKSRRVGGGSHRVRSNFSRTGGPPTGTYVRPIKTRFWKGKKSRKMRALYKYAAEPRAWQSVDGDIQTGLTGRQTVWQYDGLDVAGIEELIARVKAHDANAMTLNDDAIYLRSHSRKWQMTNHSNSLLNLKIYTFVARHDRLDGVTDSLPRIWETGLDNQIGINSTASYMDIGQEPLKVPNIGQYYKLVKKQSIKMQPGGQHTHFMSSKIGKWYTQHRFICDNGNRGVNRGVIGGLTTFTIFVMSGQPAAKHGATLDSDVTTMKGQLDIVVTNRFTYHYLNSRDWMTFGDYYSNLIQAPAVPLEVVTDVDPTDEEAG